MITIEQLKDVKERTEALYRYLDIEGKKIQVEEEQLRTQAPGFWDDQKAAEAQMKKVKALQQWITGYQEVKTLADELQLSFDFYKDELVTEEEVDEAYSKAISAVEELELKNMLRSEADQMDCVLKINSGAGGTESQDWASMLMRMYMRWAESNGYKLSVANLQEGDEAGIKTVTMNIEGSYAYGYLKGENASAQQKQHAAQHKAYCAAGEPCIDAIGVAGGKHLQRRQPLRLDIGKHDDCAADKDKPQHQLEDAGQQLLAPGVQNGQTAHGCTQHKAAAAEQPEQHIMEHPPYGIALHKGQHHQQQAAEQGAKPCRKPLLCLFTAGSSTPCR